MTDDGQEVLDNETSLPAKDVLELRAEIKVLKSELAQSQLTIEYLQAKNTDTGELGLVDMCNQLKEKLIADTKLHRAKVIETNRKAKNLRSSDHLNAKSLIETGDGLTQRRPIVFFLNDLFI